MACATQAQQPSRYALEDFDATGCMGKGRPTECGGAVMQQIFRDGTAAVPVLISQLTETRRANHQIADYWSDTRTGDIAFVLLADLFNDDERSYTPPGAIDWAPVSRGVKIPHRVAG